MVVPRDIGNQNEPQNEPKEENPHNSPMASPIHNQSEYEKPEEPESGPSKNKELPSYSNPQKSKHRSSVSTTSTPSNPQGEVTKGKRVSQKQKKEKAPNRKKGIKKEKQKVTVEMLTPRHSGRLGKQNSTKEGIGEPEGEKENREQFQGNQHQQEQQQENVTTVETNSELRGDAPDDMNATVKKRRYMVMNSNSESQDPFIANKLRKKVLDSPVYGSYEGGNEQFEDREEAYLEERNVIQELQEVLDRIKHLEELVKKYEQKY